MLQVFVTGGIGGVHRGVEQTWDVSSDLTELRRTPVAVVCAGAKSILDIPRTLEYLETLGVPVIGYQTDFFPAFFSPSSGIKSQCRMDCADQVASFLRAREMLGVCGGSVIGVPIPDEHAAEGLVVEEATQRALQEATQAKISGAEVMPQV
jgi:pseudouridine-5'-phosphate glycosidase